MASSCSDSGPACRPRLRPWGRGMRQKSEEDEPLVFSQEIIDSGEKTKLIE